MFEVYKMVLTEAGQNLYAKCLASSTDITFTKFILGNGTYAGTETTEEIAAKTALTSPKDEFQISKASVVNNSTCKLEMNASNLKITEGYFVTEIGVYAKDSDGNEVLYCITVAVPDKADWMPAYNGVAPGSLRYLMYITVGNAENIKVDVSGGGVVSQDDFNELSSEVESIKENGGDKIMLKDSSGLTGTEGSKTTLQTLFDALLSSIHSGDISTVLKDENGESILDEDGGTIIAPSYIKIL